MWHKAEGLDLRRHKEAGGALLLLFSAICTPGYEADPCHPSVKASRRTLNITEGDKAVMHCDVQHCGEVHWTGGWGWAIEPFVLLQPTPRHKLYNSTLSANGTTLFLEILSTNLSDAGQYQCRVNVGNIVLNGHVTTLNVTVAAAGGKAWPSAAVSVGVCVCICICICVLLIAVLRPACRKRCQPRNLPEEQPSARRTAHLRTEVVYASLLPTSRRPPARVGHQVQPAPTVYSFLQFPQRQSHMPQPEKGPD